MRLAASHRFIYGSQHVIHKLVYYYAFLSAVICLLTCYEPENVTANLVVTWSGPFLEFYFSEYRLVLLKHFF